MCELCDHSHTLHSLTGCDGAAGLESDGSCEITSDQSHDCDKLTPTPTCDVSK
jgi:hypothetical protein